MTTIATDGNTIAADTRIVGGDVIDGLVAQKVRQRGGVTVAVSGQWSLAEALMEWALPSPSPDTDPPKKGDDDSWELIRIEDGKCWYMSNAEYTLCRTGIPAAIGSGSTFALGAMAVGASPREAVEAAIRYDCASGGQILVYSCGLGSRS
jgi:hypothetical protein